MMFLNRLSFRFSNRLGLAILLALAVAGVGSGLLWGLPLGQANAVSPFLDVDDASRSDGLRTVKLSCLDEYSGPDWIPVVGPFVGHSPPQIYVSGYVAEAEGDVITHFDRDYTLKNDIELSCSPSPEPIELLIVDDASRSDGAIIIGLACGDSVIEWAPQLNVSGAEGDVITYDDQEYTLKDEIEFLPCDSSPGWIPLLPHSPEWMPLAPAVR